MDTIQQLRELTKTKDQATFLQGELLWKVRESGDWSKEYESFDNPEKYNFVEDLGFKKNKANKLINIYLLHKNYGVPANDIIRIGGWAKQSMILPFVIDPITAKEFVNIAIACRNQKDLKISLKEIKTGVKQTECAHLDTYTITICRTCGEKRRD